MVGEINSLNEKTYIRFVIYKRIKIINIDEQD